jgi:hypothetical protein
MCCTLERNFWGGSKIFFKGGAAGVDKYTKLAIEKSTKLLPRVGVYTPVYALEYNISVFRSIRLIL